MGCEEPQTTEVVSGMRHMNEAMVTRDWWTRRLMSSATAMVMHRDFSSDGRTKKILATH